MTAIELYRHEKAKRAGRVSAELAAVRAIIARIEANDQQHHRGGRPKATQSAPKSRSNGRPRGGVRPRELGPNYKCGCPRTPENTYVHHRRGRATPGYECKACSRDRSAARDRSKEGIARRLARLSNPNDPYYHRRATTRLKAARLSTPTAPNAL